MSGAGFAMDAIKRTRGNRSLLKKKGAFEIQKDNTFREKPFHQYAKYTFKKASPKYMIKLREQLRKDKAKRRLKLGVTLVLTIGFGLYILLNLMI